MSMMMPEAVVPVLVTEVVIVVVAPRLTGFGEADVAPIEKLGAAPTGPGMRVARPRRRTRSAPTSRVSRSMITSLCTKAHGIRYRPDSRVEQSRCHVGKRARNGRSRWRRGAVHRQDLPPAGAK